MTERKVILLVEDNPDDEKLILMALQKGNITNEIVVARDGQEALEKLLGAPGKPPITPTVVLLDLHLPKIDGLEVLKKLRGSDKTKHLPVVMLTSSDEEGDRVRSYDLGANSYVCKPVDFGAFAGAVNQLGLYWLLLNRPAP
ncbi:MAG: response regulator [Elusimicrobiota bacterium]|nr:MAG: response regulator [Elusimicrobiota bacterium]